MENSKKNKQKGRPTNKSKSTVFKDRLNTLYGNSGDNQEKAAEALGTTRQTFGNWLAGRNEPDFEKLIKVADYYKVSADYLLGRTESKSIDNKIQATREVTGLSDDAINKLSELYKENRITAYTDILSMLLEFGNTEYMLALIAAKISYYAIKKGLKDFDLVKNMIDRTMPLDIDGLHITAYKDNLIEAILQSEFINSLNMVRDEYILRYSKMPAECKRVYEEYEKNIGAKLKKGEITLEQYTNMIEQYLNGGADNGKHQGKQE